jgi:hypothetical protein
MNALRTLENMIAGLVEGIFGRVFKAEVRPMELARKLAREMDENRTASVSRVYAPNEYSVWLSAKDRARYEGVEHEVIEELCAYLLEHARSEDLALASRPRVTFYTDERLQLGEFGIEARLVAPEERGGVSGGRGDVSDERAREGAAAPAAARERSGDRGVGDRGVGKTMIFSNAERVRGGLERVGGGRRSKALLLVGGRRLLVPPRGAIVGRSRDCDIVLEDSGVSRRHAELRPEGGAWVIEDLGSTNGVRVNGFAIVGAHALSVGDRIEMGSTEIVFEVAP